MTASIDLELTWTVADSEMLDAQIAAERAVCAVLPLRRDPVIAADLLSGDEDDGDACITCRKPLWRSTKKPAGYVKHAAGGRCFGCYQKDRRRNPRRRPNIAEQVQTVMAMTHQGMTMPEISEQLGISVTTVMRRRHIGRALEAGDAQ